MSRQAIAAALACEGLTGGERLVAFSLASYAGPDARAFPGTTVAAARAGLSRSRYLHDRDRLVRRGLVVIEQAASGRGHSSTVALAFATQGPWWEGEINAELFERVLSFTRARGPARLLLAAMAAVADRDGVVRGVSNDEVWRAAGLAERTYWRARPGLLESGELVLLEAARGRGTLPAAVNDARTRRGARRRARGALPRAFGTVRRSPAIARSPERIVNTRILSARAFARISARHNSGSTPSGELT
jgi:hypothetical protein